MVDGAVPGIGDGDAVIDEPFVEGQVGERAGLGQPIGAFRCRPSAVIGLRHGHADGPGLALYGRAR